MVSQEEKRQQMLSDPVEKLVCRLAVPTIITMMITSLYNMADTYFVGRISTIATAAVGIALPLMNIIQAMGFFFGHGSGNYVAGKLGAGDTKAALKMGDTAALLSMTTGTLMCIGGMCFLYPLADILGAEEELVEPTIEYISVLLIGIPFQMTSFTLNNQLRFQGNAFYGMIGMASGSVLNVILDPIFILVLGMGIKGAALATILSQITAFIVLMIMSGRIPFRKPVFEINSDIVVSLFKYGCPSLFRQAVMSVAAICLNHAAADYGAALIAAVSVVNKIVMLGCSVIIGFGQGFQPVCGFNSGAGKFDRVKKTYLFCLKTATLFMTIYGLIVFIFTPQLIRFFRDDPEVVQAGILILRIQCITAPLQGIIVITNMILQNMGRTVRASVLAVARQGLFFIPLLNILSYFFGVRGIQVTQSAADLLTAIVTAPMAVLVVRELDRKVSQMNEQPQTAADGG